MRFDIITVLPDLLQSPFAHSILQRAQNKNIVQIRVHNLREYATGKHKNVDDYQYGGGSGMVMMIEPFVNCIEHLQKENTYDGVVYNDQRVLLDAVMTALGLTPKYENEVLYNINFVI